MKKEYEIRIKKRENIFLGILTGVIGLLVAFGVVVGISTANLHSFISHIEKVEYDNQLIPIKEEEGYYTFRTDRELKVMTLNDLHIGGGYFTMDKDQKTIYELSSMIQQEKPDLVILNGDMIFAVPGVMFNGGGTINNKKATKYVLETMERLGVYYSVTFGNHETEAFDLTNREKIGKVYSNDEYPHCIFESNYSEIAGSQSSVSNQCILVKNSVGVITRAIMLIDSNAYVNDAITSSINMDYDVIHNGQAIWAFNTLSSLKEANNGKDVKSLFFLHMPTGEFQTAYEDLEQNGFKSTPTTQYIEGIWGDKINSKYGMRIAYGGWANSEIAPENNDVLFELLGPDGLDSMQGMFAAHDHCNNAVVIYKGVMLSYNYSLDNTAYNDIANYGLQRGCTVLKLSSDGFSFTQEHKNAYLDYDIDSQRYYNVTLEKHLYEDYVPTK